MANNKKAKKMASKGASVKANPSRQQVLIEQLHRSSLAQKAPSRPVSYPLQRNGQFPASNTANSRTDPKPNTSTSRSTPEIKGVGQGIRLAGANGISKSNFNTLAETTGKSDDKIVGKLDKINTKLAEKGKAGINLSSGTANMLVRNAQKSPDKYPWATEPLTLVKVLLALLYKVCSQLQQRPGTWIKGQLIGGREADSWLQPWW
jgi:hypothetical protein